MLNDKQRELARDMKTNLTALTFGKIARSERRIARLVSLEADIADLLDAVEIKEDYRLFLHLRFIVGLSMPEVSARMLITRRWAQRLQNRALLAFAQSV